MHDQVHEVALSEFTGSLEEWDGLATMHGTVFHSSRWLAILERSQPARLIRLGLRADGRQIGILPLFVKRYFPLTVGASPMVLDNTPYLGVACEQPYLQRAFGAARTYANQHGIHFLRLLQQGLFTAESLDSTCAYVEKHTHVIDLTRSTDEIWKKMQGRSRTSIRKAEKSGVVVVQETSRACIEPYYAILTALYGRQSMEIPNAKEFYSRLWDEFADRGLFVLSALYEGKQIAGAIFLKDRHWVYYLNGCSLAAYNHLNANSAIQWQAIQIAKALGARSYDFVGSDIPRLAAFKESFGGDLVSYSLIESASHRWVAAVRKAYPQAKVIARRIRGQLRRTPSE